MIRKLIYLILATMLVGAAAAQDVSIRADHPDEYVVVKGDTLWDISARFLDKPWQWPAIWHANPQVENPHLIYPGDRLSLVYEDGRPRLMVNRDKPVQRLSPQARVTQRAAITAIPLSLLKPFIKDARVLAPADFSSLPRRVGGRRRVGCGCIRASSVHRRSGPWGRLEILFLVWLLQRYLGPLDLSP